MTLKPPYFLPTNLTTSDMTSDFDRLLDMLVERFALPEPLPKSFRALLQLVYNCGREVGKFERQHTILELLNRLEADIERSTLSKEELQ